MSGICLYSRRTKDGSNARDREILSLRRQLDSTNEELTSVGRAREVALRENRRFQDDLATMTRENQVNTDIGFEELFPWEIYFPNYLIQA